MPRMKTGIVTLLIALPAMLLLGACEELAPIAGVSKEQGVYRGELDTPLEEQQVEELRRRARIQSGLHL